MKVGDIVVPIDRDQRPLRSGSEVYSCAVVVNLWPLVLVSFDADMRWQSTVQHRQFTVLGTADTATFERCMARLGTELFETRHAASECSPVCDMTSGSLGVAVTAWVDNKPTDAFYGMRQNMDDDQRPHFYYAGTIVSGVTHWQYRQEPERT